MANGSMSPVVGIICAILMVVESVFLLGFWQLVSSGAVDKILKHRYLFPQLTIGLFDDSEILVNDEENSSMEQLPSIKVDPKEKTLSTAEETDRSPMLVNQQNQNMFSR